MHVIMKTLLELNNRKSKKLIFMSTKGEFYSCYLMNMQNLQNLFTQVIIEGFKPHVEPKLAVDDISFSKEQCQQIACKYNGDVTIMMGTKQENEKSSRHFYSREASY